MVNQEVIIEIRPDGTIEVRGQGFVGPACVEHVRQVAQALGIETESQATVEYYYEVEYDRYLWTGRKS